MIVADARRILGLLSEIAALEEAIEELCEESELARKLRSIPGFRTISAAELAGEIGTLDRFSSEASLALYLGMCPLDKQSGQLHGTNSPRQVNERAKAAMMVAVAHHIWEVPESRAYYNKKRTEGKRHNQAVRSMARHLVRVMWSMIKHGRDYEVREVSCPC
jgi:transposase